MAVPEFSMRVDYGALKENKLRALLVTGVWGSYNPEFLKENLVHTLAYAKFIKDHPRAHDILRISSIPASIPLSFGFPLNLITGSLIFAAGMLYTPIMCGLIFSTCANIADEYLVNREAKKHDLKSTFDKSFDKLYGTHGVHEAIVQ
jgi:hypothetical protein